MPDFRWYRNRLVRMSPGEIGFRIVRMIRAPFERLRTSQSARTPKPILDRLSLLPAIPPIAVDEGRYLFAADEAASGRGRVLSLADAAYGPDFGWNRDPKTGTMAPLSFGKGLDYRDRSLVGDIKYLWEPNRHLHFPTLAQAFSLSGNVAYVQALARHIRTWIEQCPCPLGPNWSSALEAGIRLVNWSVTWRLLGGIEGVRCLTQQHDFPIEEWLQSVYHHLQFVSGFYSGYSSANNHVIGEAAGVYIGCLTWPYWPMQKRWRWKARQILIEECERQIAPDGVTREQAISYQQFVFDFLVLGGIAGEQAQEAFPDAYWARLERMVGFVAALIAGTGEVPQIGDSDDALAVALAPDAQDAPYRSMLYLGGRLFQRADWEQLAGGPNDKARWMLSGTALNVADRVPRKDRSAVMAPRAFIQSFPNGGYHILRAGGTDAPSVKVLFDTGPLGYLSIAAHGHADALALLLWLDDAEFLIDAGTYAYHTEERWRSYFRGTRAHNTVAIDAEDQSVSGGNFMWLYHADARCLRAAKSNGELIVRGEHDGYSRLADPVHHVREVAVVETGEIMTVKDEILCRGRHCVELFWHFAEACDVSVEGSKVRALRNGRWLELSPGRENVETMVRYGSENPIGGWRSRRFGEKAACRTVIWRIEIEGPSTIESHFRFGGGHKVS